MRLQDRALPPLHGVYRVTGRRQYRGHEPGTTFHARLEREAERRAIERGDIELLERIEPALSAGSFKLPKDWLRMRSVKRTRKG
jgi:hypothetical protein